MPASHEINSGKSSASAGFGIAAAVLFGLAVVGVIVAPITWQSIKENKRRAAAAKNLQAIQKALDEFKAKSTSAAGDGIETPQSKTH